MYSPSGSPRSGSDSLTVTRSDAPASELPPDDVVAVLTLVPIFDRGAQGPDGPSERRINLTREANSVKAKEIQR